MTDDNANSTISDATADQMSAEQRRSLAATTLRHARRIVVLVVGLTVVAAGIAMLVLPGPGLVAIVAGLAILATEFAWAQRYLEKTKEKAAQGVDVGKKAVGRFRTNSSTDS